ncbi:general stress protein [Neobacillus terrae]|uniref:general stress protein n=1 Tax=Neobacillus terrae TaxID=3034837 RepID=UPI00140831E5|nr:general stress protein [Neobacillus terrae]NHM32835.1 general stress protein [Neobacillus terrae]
MYIYKVAENLQEARNTVNGLKNEGYLLDDIYIFAYDEKQSEEVIEETDTNDDTIEEDGLIDIMAYFFSSRIEEVHDKMLSLGLSHEDVTVCEKEVENGKFVIVAIQAD